MANVKTNIFDLNSYEPSVKTIDRPTTGEYASSPEMTELANLGTRVNTKMLQAFERFQSPRGAQAATERYTKKKL